MRSVKKTLKDLLKEVGYFEVYTPEMGGTIVNRYTVDEIDYVQVEYPNSPGVLYTYILGE